MNGIDSISTNKSGEYLQGMQMQIREKLGAAKEDGTVSRAFGDAVATLSECQIQGIRESI